MWFAAAVFCLSVFASDCSIDNQKVVIFNKDPIAGCPTMGQMDENEKVNEWLKLHPAYVFHGWKCSSRPIPEQQDGI